MSARRVTVNGLLALDERRAGFQVGAHTLPPSASADGVLGFDLLRDWLLTIDFRHGVIALA